MAYKSFRSFSDVYASFFLSNMMQETGEIPKGTGKNEGKYAEDSAIDVNSLLKFLNFLGIWELCFL